VIKKNHPYNLREHINVCFVNGNYTDLKCNLNGLQRGQFIGTREVVPRPKKGDLLATDFSLQVEEDWSGGLPAKLDDKHLKVSFNVNKFVYDDSFEVWSHVKLSAFADYDRVKMSVYVTDIKGVRTKVGSARSLHTIISPGYALAAWLPLICKAPANTTWQVVVEATVGREAIYVDKPILVKDPLWSRSRFKKL